MTLASKRLGMKLLVWLILFTILTVNLTSDLKASSTSTGFNLTHNFQVQEITTKVNTTYIICNYRIKLFVRLNIFKF